MKEVFATFFSKEVWGLNSLLARVSNLEPFSMKEVGTVNNSLRESVEFKPFLH